MWLWMSAVVGYYARLWEMVLRQNIDPLHTLSELHVDQLSLLVPSLQFSLKEVNVPLVQVQILCQLHG